MKRTGTLYRRSSCYHWAAMLIAAVVVLPGGEWVVDQAKADPFDLLLTIPNPFPAPNDQFGFAVAAMGNDILVGANNDDTHATDAGAAYLFDGTTGDLLQTFLSPDADEHHRFGSSVAVVGNSVLIGTRRDLVNPPHDAAHTGAAYLFDGSDGSLQQKFLDPNPEPNPIPGSNDWFGGFASSTAAIGNDVLIGTARDNTAAKDAGAVYLFDGSDGNVIQTFVSPTPTANANFGIAVAVVGNDKVLVGADFAPDSGVGHTGAAYLFDAATGEHLQRFLSLTPSSGDEFGRSVAALGDNVLVSARGDDSDGFNTGIVYMYDSSTGNVLQRFRNPTPQADDRFGRWVTAADGMVLVGGRGDDTGAVNAGAAYLFDASTGVLLHTFLNPTPEEGDQFGRWGTFLDNGSVAISSGRDDAGGEDAGAVYVFEGVGSVALGDINADSIVNGLDVDPFVDVLLNGTDDNATRLRADMNQDDVVDGLDVDPFVAAVLDSGGTTGVPEPSALALATIALIVFAGCVWRGIFSYT